MSIRVIGKGLHSKEFSTLEDNMLITLSKFYSDKKIVEAYVNGVRCYPDGDYEITYRWSYYMDGSSFSSSNCNYLDSSDFNLRATFTMKISSDTRFVLSEPYILEFKNKDNLKNAEIKIDATLEIVEASGTALYEVSSSDTDNGKHIGAIVEYAPDSYLKSKPSYDFTYTKAKGDDLIFEARVNNDYIGYFLQIYNSHDHSYISVFNDGEMMIHAQGVPATLTDPDGEVHTQRVMIKSGWITSAPTYEPYGGFSNTYYGLSEFVIPYEKYKIIETHNVINNFDD